MTGHGTTSWHGGRTDDQSIWTAWTRPQHPLLEDSQVFCPFICFSMSTTRAASISENAIARVASSTSGCEPTAVHSNRFLCISKWRNSQRRSLKPIKSGDPDSCSKKGCFLVSTIVLNHYKVWRTLVNVLILFFSVLYCSVSAGVASAISCATNRCTGRRCDLAHFNSSCSHNHLHNCFSSVPAQMKRIVLVLLPPGSSSQEKGNGLQGSRALGPHRHASVLDSPGDHRYPGCHSGVIFQRTLSYHLLVYQHASWGWTVPQSSYKCKLSPGTNDVMPESDFFPSFLPNFIPGQSPPTNQLSYESYHLEKVRSSLWFLWDMWRQPTSFFFFQTVAHAAPHGRVTHSDQSATVSTVFRARELTDIHDWFWQGRESTPLLAWKHGQFSRLVTWLGLV